MIQMDQQSRLIVFGAAAFIIFAAIAGGVVYLVRTPQSRVEAPTETTTDLSSRLPVVSSNPSEAAVTPPPGMKIYTGQKFGFNYPEGWGLVTCANSENLELDPANGADAKDIVCDVALKPITVLMADRLSCSGETVTLGGRQVVQSKVSSGGDTNYRWCVAIGDKALDITHRVSLSGSRATSKEDFSVAIEQVIMTISTPGSGS